MTEIFTGSYIGNATGSTWISLPTYGSGITPGFILIRGNSVKPNDGGILYIGSQGAWTAGSKGLPEIQSVLDVAVGSFQIDDGFEVNVNEVEYHYMGIADNAVIFESGSYIGDGTDNRQISTGSQPIWIIIAKQTSSAVIQKIGDVGSTPLFFGLNQRLTNDLLYINSSGFKVMDNTYTNTSGGSYNWATFFDTPELSIGSYFGDNTNDRSIDVGLDMLGIFIKPDENVGDANPGSLTQLIFGLLSYYSFDTSEGSDIHGTFDGNISGAVQVPGKLGSCYGFDGTDDLIEVTTDHNLPDGTISFWFNSDDGGQTAWLVGNGNGGGEFDVKLQTGSIKGSSRIGGVDRSVQINYGSSGVWTHITYTWKSSSTDDHTRLYIDGVLAGSVEGDFGAITDAGFNLVMGRRTNSAVQYFSGSMDEIGLWDVPLSADDVTMLYNLGSGQRYPFHKNYAAWKTTLMSGSEAAVTQGSTVFSEKLIKTINGSTFNIGSDLNE